MDRYCGIYRGSAAGKIVALHMTEPCFFSYTQYGFPKPH